MHANPNSSSPKLPWTRMSVINSIAHSAWTCVKFYIFCIREWYSLELVFHARESFGMFVLKIHALTQPICCGLQPTWRNNCLPTEVNSGVSAVRRVGEFRDGGWSLVISQCTTAEFRRKVLQNSPNLKDYRTAKNKKIFLNSVMTRQQQDVDEKLKEELWSRRQGGEYVLIRRGKIVARVINSTMHADDSQA